MGSATQTWLVLVAIYLVDPARSHPQLYGPPPYSTPFNHQQQQQPSSTFRSPLHEDVLSLPTPGGPGATSSGRYGGYPVPNPNRLPTRDGVSSKPVCQKQNFGNEIRFICAGPTPTFHTKYILWLESSTSNVRLPPIRIEVPNYKLDDWIQAGYKAKANPTSSSKSVINVLVKKPELSFQASAEAPPTQSLDTDAEVHLDYEPVHDKIVHFPEGGKLDILPVGSIPEPGGGSRPRQQQLFPPSSQSQIDIRTYQSQNSPPSEGLYKRDVSQMNGGGMHGYHQYLRPPPPAATAVWQPYRLLRP